MAGVEQYRLRILDRERLTDEQQVRVRYREATPGGGNLVIGNRPFH
jgi:hypothetical protein